MRGLADQVGQGERDQGVHSGLVLEPGLALAGSLAEGVPQGALPRSAQALRDVVRPWAERRALAGGIRAIASGR